MPGGAQEPEEGQGFSLDKISNNMRKVRKVRQKSEKIQNLLERVGATSCPQFNGSRLFWIVGRFLMPVILINSASTSPAPLLNLSD